MAKEFSKHLKWGPRKLPEEKRELRHIPLLDLTSRKLLMMGVLQHIADSHNCEMRVAPFPWKPTEDFAL